MEGVWRVMRLWSIRTSHRHSLLRCVGIFFIGVLWHRVTIGSADYDRYFNHFSYTLVLHCFVSFMQTYLHQLLMKVLYTACECAGERRSLEKSPSPPAMSPSRKRLDDHGAVTESSQAPSLAASLVLSQQAAHKVVWLDA